MLEVESKNIIELSKIGDPFVNFTFSLALSKVKKRPLGRKVSNQILSEALRRADLRQEAGSRMSKGDLGDYAEGLIFRSWALEKVTLEECVDILYKHLSSDSRGKDLIEESISGFEALLRHIALK